MIIYFLSAVSKHHILSENRTPHYKNTLISNKLPVRLSLCRFHVQFYASEKCHRGYRICVFRYPDTSAQTTDAKTEYEETTCSLHRKAQIVKGYRRKLPHAETLDKNQGFAAFRGKQVFQERQKHRHQRQEKKRPTRKRESS